MIVRDVLAEATNVLSKADVESSSLDASLLLAEVLNISRSSLMAAASQPLTEESLAAFNHLMQRRLAGECVAYILGRKEFYGLEFLVNPSVLVPRPDTETLVETALEELGIEEQPYRVLDLCTGSGAIAVTLKHQMPELEVWATDISAEALATAKANAVRLLPGGGEGVHFCYGDLYDALPAPTPQSLFSVILSNAPYVPSAEIGGLSPEVRREPLLALDGGDDGLGIIKRIICRAPEFLCPGGVLLLEADPRQMERIAFLLAQAGFAGIQTHKDLSGKERVIGAILNIQPC